LAMVFLLVLFNLLSSIYLALFLPNFINLWFTNFHPFFFSKSNILGGNFASKQRCSCFLHACI
jgi:hypothetical protein